MEHVRNPLKRIISHSILIDTIHQVYRILLPAERKKGLIVIVFILFSAFLDVFSLASVLPFILLALDSSIIQSNTYLSFVYDSFGFRNENQFLLVVVLFILFIFVFKNVVSLIISHFQSGFAYNVASGLSERQFLGYYEKDYLSFVNSTSSLLARNILHIPVEFSVYVLLASITFLSDSTVLALIGGSIAIYNFQIFSLLLLIITPPFLIMYQGKRNKLSQIGQRSKEILPLSMKHLFHGIDGYIDVRLHRKETYFVSKFSELQRKLNMNWALFHTVNSIPARLIEVTAILGVVLIFVYTLLFSQSKNEMIFLLSLFTAAAFRIMPSLNRMFSAVVNIRTFRHTIDVLREVDGNLSTHRSQDSGKTQGIRFNEYIAFRNVCFSYPNGASRTLNNVSFVVRKGEKVGFIGRSGSGKTTVMNVLLRFLREQAGQVVVDGIPLAPEDTEAWRGLIGYVKQDPFLLDGSIAENVAFGEEREEMDLEKLRLAIEQAGLADFVRGLADGVETHIGEQGAKLSGGQRQRLAIARALYRNSQILIFDQATSELDDQTEKEIIDAIEKLSNQNHTILIIAHRISSLKNCDRIYELEHGEITGIYRYAEMLDKELQQT